MSKFPPVSREPYTFLEIENLRFRKFIPHTVIQDRVAYLGKQLLNDYKDKNPIVIGVLKGAVFFLTDLLQHSELACDMDFTQLSSYKGLKSSGEITDHLPITLDVKGRHLIVVEDIVDTGGTLYYFLELLRKKEPASIELAALLLKPEALKYDIDVKYLGFNIADQFVVGYGMDYNEAGRNLKDIYQLDLPKVGF